MRDHDREIFHEYIFRRLCEIADEEDELIRAIRTKKGLVILTDKLRRLDVEREIIVKLYDELKNLI